MTTGHISKTRANIDKRTTAFELGQNLSFKGKKQNFLWSKIFFSSPKKKNYNVKFFLFYSETYFKQEISKCTFFGGLGGPIWLSRTEPKINLKGVKNLRT